MHLQPMKLKAFCQCDVFSNNADGITHVTQYSQGGLLSVAKYLDQGENKHNLIQTATRFLESRYQATLAR